jgi:hypothetical protein
VHFLDVALELFDKCVFQRNGDDRHVEGDPRKGAVIKRPA